MWHPNAKDTSNGYMNGYYLRNDNRTEVANTWCVSEYIEVSPNTQYTLKWTTSVSPSATLPSICQYDANKDFISNSGTSYDANNTVTITATATTKYIRFSGVISTWNVGAIRFNLGSTVIDVPPGYKIPISLESGEQTQNLILYIGDSQLSKTEYVDYERGKIYKLQEGVLTPTDPPTPFPSIITYDGKNTISSTETLGDVELTGEWTAIMGSTEEESIDIDFTVDADSFIAFVTVDDSTKQVFDTITMPSSAGSFTLHVVSWGREPYTDTVYNALS